VDNNTVQGINLGTVTVGNGASINAGVTSTQTASASTVEDPGSLGNNAYAAVGSGDNVRGIESTVITAGGSTSLLQATAALTGGATASNVNGASTAEAGLGAAIYGGATATTTVGNDLVGGALFDARSTLGATASSVGASATADAGNSTTLVNGLFNSDMVVGDNAGTIFGQATSTVSAAASTSGSLTGQATTATANALQDAIGVDESRFTIGGDGNLTALANLNGSATASNVGDTTAKNDNSLANLTLKGTGLSQADDPTVIGGSGSVIGQALVNGGSTAQSVNGIANGSAGITTKGLDLNNAGADITIGKSGSITGFAVTGGVTGSTLTDQVDVTASTTAGAANAGGSFDTTGIFGAGTGTVLTAGPNGGNIFGTAIGGAKVIASTSTGNALTDIGNGQSTFSTSDATTTDIVGITNVNMFGGQVGTNNIVGSGFGKFDSAATAVTGNATGVSNVNVNGILGTGNAITTSGNVSAQANLSNTVVASTVTGAATATAVSNAVGLQGYNVTIIGSGNLIAGANSSTITTASSNNGNASA